MERVRSNNKLISGAFLHYISHHKVFALILLWTCQASWTTTQAAPFRQTQLLNILRLYPRSALYFWIIWEAGLLTGMLPIFCQNPSALLIYTIQLQMNNYSIFRINILPLSVSSLFFFPSFYFDALLEEEALLEFSRSLPYNTSP